MTKINEKEAEHGHFLQAEHHEHHLLLVGIAQLK